MADTRQILPGTDCHISAIIRTTMTKAKKPTGLDSATEALLLRMDAARHEDERLLLASFLAALVNPDIVCPIASLRVLDSETKRLVFCVFDSYVNGTSDAAKDAELNAYLTYRFMRNSFPLH